MKQQEKRAGGLVAAGADTEEKGITPLGSPKGSRQEVVEGSAAVGA